MGILNNSSETFHRDGLLVHHMHFEDI